MESSARASRSPASRGAEAPAPRAPFVSARELGHQADCLDLRRADDKRADLRGLPRLEAIADALLGAAEVERVDERVGHRGDRLLLLAREIEVLDLDRLRLEAHLADVGV